MTRQAPYGWPQPPHAAQHAAPRRPSTQLGQHAGRALRLLAAAGTGAAGLCAIVGSLALVVSATEPARATHAAARPQASRGAAAHPDAERRAGTGPAGTGPAGTGQPPAVFTGRGSRTTRQFTIGGNGNWTLQWSYSCQASGHRGSFAVREDGTDPLSGVSVSQHGTAGHGVTRTERDTGTHYLVISSGCAWTLTALLRP